MLRSRTLALIATAGVLCAADPAAIFTDHAVLQRGEPIPVWGTGKDGEQVTVRFAGQERTATVGKDGTWKVVLDRLPASKEGRDLVITGALGGEKTEKKLANVLVGEVWICSGQSNMEWNVGNSLNAKDEIAGSNAYPHIRHIKVALAHSAKPETAFKGSWAQAGEKTTSSFTAVGYYFARELATTLDVPVGLIGTNWGGTRIEPWINPEGFRAVPELKGLSAQVDSWDATTETGRKAHQEFLAKLKAWMPEAEAALKAGKPVPAMPGAPVPADNRDAPTRLWNAMVAPLVPYAVRGTIWYQGEANGGEGDSYLHKLQALNAGWRQAFGQADMSFYLVQLANYQSSDPKNAAGGDGWSKLREAQRQAVAKIDRCGMAVAIDVGDGKDIHPRNKQDVGKRLAQWALAKDYGKAVVASGPLYKSHAVEGSAIRVSFDYTGGGLIVGEKKGLEPVQPVAGGALTWWSIAGEDRKWVKAEAKIDGDTVVVSSPAVAKPVAVRYAFAMNPEGCNLYNKAGMPASPFRTDAW